MLSPEFFWFVINQHILRFTFIERMSVGSEQVINSKLIPDDSGMDIVNVTACCKIC